MEVEGSSWTYVGKAIVFWLLSMWPHWVCIEPFISVFLDLCSKRFKGFSSLKLGKRLLSKNIYYDSIKILLPVSSASLVSCDASIHLSRRFITIEP